MLPAPSVFMLPSIFSSGGRDLLSNYYVSGRVLGKMSKRWLSSQDTQSSWGRWGWWQTYMKRRMLMMCKCTFMEKRASLVTGLAGIKAGGCMGEPVDIWYY